MAAPSSSAQPAEPTSASPESRRTLLRRAAFLTALLSMTVFLVVLNWYKMSNNDIWIHLKTGEWILEHGWVPGNDMYSWNATDRPYIAFEWLAGLFFYFVYELGGVNGLIFSKMGIAAATWWLLYDTSRILGARLSVLLPGMALVIYIAVARLLERPHILTYLFIALFIWLFFRYRERGRNRLWLYALLPAQVLWINMHGAWPTGILLVATFALGEGLARARAVRLGAGEERALPPSEIKFLAALIPATALVNFVNPYGWRMITFPFEVFAMDVYMTGIYEWKPPYDRAFNSSTMFFFYMIELILLCAGFFIAQGGTGSLLPGARGGRRGGGPALGTVNILFLVALAIFATIMTVLWLQPPASESGWLGDLDRMVPVAGKLLRFVLRLDPPEDMSGWSPLNVGVALYVLFALFGLFTVLNYRSVDFTQAGIFSLLFLISIGHNRNVTDAAIGIFPVMAASLSATLARRGSSAAATSSRRRGRAGRASFEETPSAQAAQALPWWRHPPDPSSPAAVFTGSALLLAISLHAALTTYYYDFRGAGREKGLGIAENMPVCGVDFIEKHHLTGNAFTSYPYASLLIHRMYPSVKVNMDSRNGHVYGEKIYQDYLNTLQDPALMLKYLASNDVDFFFLSHGDRRNSVFEAVMATGQWAIVFLDNRGFVIVKRTPENAALIAREEYNYIRPNTWGDTVVNPITAPSVLAEAEHAIANCPASTFGYTYKLRALLTLRRYDEAITTAQLVLRMDPDNPQIYTFLGGIYEATQRTSEAIEMYDRALAINPDLQMVRKSLERLRGL